MRHPDRPPCGAKMQNGARCIRPAGHKAKQHRKAWSRGVYLVDANKAPLRERPTCWARGGCCLHPSTRDYALTIAAERGVVSVADVANAQGTAYATASSALTLLLKKGRLVRVAPGRYALPAKQQLGGQRA